MSEKDDNIYSRGKYRLAWDRKRDGTLRSPYPQIVWYDDAAKRLRSRSTGSTDMSAAQDALDRLYLERERGQTHCPTCGQPFKNAGGYLVTTAIADYLLEKENVVSFDALRHRLAHVMAYIDHLKTETLTTDQVDEDWIAKFRLWMASPASGGAKMAGTIEGSVRALQSALNRAFNRKRTQHSAQFTPKKASEVSKTPLFRADVALLARMFAYAMDKSALKSRQNLLRFLQISVATWCRPDAAHDFSTDPARRQWLSEAKVLSLNPAGRTQTRKYRAVVPVPGRFALLIDATDGYFITVKSVRKAFEAMAKELELPGERESGMKLIRRSIAHIVRRRIGEEHWVQGEMMLGHRKASTSDLYALPDPANLGRAAQATADVIAEIEAITPRAFSRYNTGLLPDIKGVKNAKTT